MRCLMEKGRPGVSTVEFGRVLHFPHFLKARSALFHHLLLDTRLPIVFTAIFGFRICLLRRCSAHGDHALGCFSLGIVRG